MRALGRALDWLAERVARVLTRELRRRGLLHSPSRQLLGTCECRECVRARSARKTIDDLRAEAELNAAYHHTLFVAKIQANRAFARARGVPRLGALRARLIAARESRATHEDT